jgi:hypothetical protein
VRLLRSIFVAASLVLVLLMVSEVPDGLAAPAKLSDAEQAAVFKAAGFKKAKGGRYIKCEEDPQTPSYTPGQIELVDLNGDGRPEAWVMESSSFCYGSPHSFFALMRKTGGVWREMLNDIGIPVVLKTKRGGWPDIEVGGPGFGKFPVYRWNGKSYARVAPKRP